MTRSTTDAGRGSPGRRPARPGPGGRRVALGVCAALLVLLGLAGAALTARVDRLDVDLPGGPGTTWLLVGTDSRTAVPAGAPVEHFGTADDVPGARADVVLVVRSGPEGTTALSVPRDLLVRPSGTRPTRLALTWLDGPQGTVDALCSLGIGVDHVVAVDLAGFAAVVDAAGGLDVEIERPVRDPAAGLALERAGRQTVDGATALALVRSRHPQHLVDGAWVPVRPDPEGRGAAAGVVLGALADAVAANATRPGRVPALAWAASGALAVDRGTTPLELAALAGTDLADVAVLPADPGGPTGLFRSPTAGTAATLAAAGHACPGRDPVSRP